MSSLTRILGILDLFDLERSFWTSDQIMQKTGYSRPTTFRYLKELRQAGLLARFGGGYVLGAKAVKLDYIIRQTDPLLKLLDPIMAGLRDHTDCDVILATLLGEEFFATIHHMSGNTNVSWPRGRPMPLTRGAGGLVVLATLSPAHLRKVLDRAISAGSLSHGDAAKLREELASIAKQGHAISLGALEPGNVGIAVPVSLPSVPKAALILVMSRKRFNTTDPAVVIKLLKQGREEMMGAYEKLDSLE